MSRLIDFQLKEVFYITAGIAIWTGFLYNLHNFAKRALNSHIPKKWKKVGEVGALICYPIKSCAPIFTNNFNCTQIGPQHDEIGDRLFMLVRPNGDYVSARSYPTMFHITSKIKDNIITINAPGMSNIAINISKLFSMPSMTARILKQVVEVIDTGDEAAQWFSRFLLNENFGLRFVFYSKTFSTRSVMEKNLKFDTMISYDAGALHNKTSFMLINQASVDDLNTRIEKSIKPLQLRPNIVIKGANAYDEDNWKWIKIGNQTIFRVAMPCTRCSLTTIDPETAERSLTGDPLKTLNKYRQFEVTGAGSPWMGVLLGNRVAGKIQIGDDVYVDDQ